MLLSFRQHIRSILPGNGRCLLAVSGGVDSVVLTDLVHHSGIDYEIAHCNFQLRGAESMRDEDFVRSVGERYEKNVYVKRFDTSVYASTHRISIQEAARKLRYDWFAEIIGEWEGGGYILTAHHADDNIETVLMRFFRGTGIQGLTGIPPFDAERKLLRPLLMFRKAELETYAAENEIAYVEDSSNASDKYARNYFRNQLLPNVREVYAQADDNILHNIARLREAAELYRQAVDIHLSRLIERKGNEIHVAVLKLKKCSPLTTIVWELVKPMGFHAAQTTEVIKLLDAVNGSYLSSSTHRIIRNRNWLILSPLETDTAQHIVIEKNEREIRYANGKLCIESAHFNPNRDAAEAFVNPDLLSYPLLLRRWKTGDYFYPLGMQKKKKISRFLIDLKLSKTEKEKVWVLESNKKIVWVVGYRIDHRFRIVDETKPAVHIRIEENH